MCHIFMNHAITVMTYRLESILKGDPQATNNTQYTRN